MSEELIDRLAGELRPTPRLAVARRLATGLAVGAAVSAALTGATLGWRPDMVRAVREAMFWVKLAYTLALCGVALWTCERLARPGVAAGRRLPWLSAPMVGVMLPAALQL